MSRAILILRPEPGAARTAERISALGLDPLVYSLFHIEGVPWDVPRAGIVDALLITSANGVRFAGPRLAEYRDRPVYVVGDATAEAARQMGLNDIRIGGGDVASTLPLIHADGQEHVLHLSGEHVRPYDPGSLRVMRAIVYRAVPSGDSAGLARTIAGRRDVVALVHSPRAGKRLDMLMAPETRPAMAVVAISAAAAQACGAGWSRVVHAVRPDEPALLHRLQTLASGEG